MKTFKLRALNRIVRSANSQASSNFKWRPLATNSYNVTKLSVSSVDLEVTYLDRNPTEASIKNMCRFTPIFIEKTLSILAL